MKLCRSDTRSIQGRTVDALAPGGEEGRDKLRKAGVSRKWAVTPGCPNGATRQAGGLSSAQSGGEPAELKHLSRRRKRKQQ